MDEFRVPKRRIPAEVILPNGASRRVAFFVSEFAAGHPGPERVSDLLQHASAFLPALDLQTDGTTFLQVRALAVVRVPREEEELPGAGATIPFEHEVELTLMDGGRLKGLLTYELPPDRSRLVDHLNELQPFLRLHERGQVALVNKRFIAHIDPLPNG